LTCSDRCRTQKYLKNKEDRKKKNQEEKIKQQEIPEKVIHDMKEFISFARSQMKK
jgi:hypothetical protein